LTEKRKRGRPKAWWNDPPQWVIDRRESGDPSDVAKLLDNLNDAAREFSKGYPINASTAAIAAIQEGDALPQKQDATAHASTALNTAFGIGRPVPERKSAEVYFIDLEAKNAKARVAGSQSTAAKRDQRAGDVCKKNIDLIERIKPNGPYTKNAVAKQIHKEWSTIEDWSLPGSEKLTERGIGGLALSVNTLTRYIDLFQRKNL
jgi:hypothetical protein